MRLRRGRCAVDHAVAEGAGSAVAAGAAKGAREGVGVRERGGGGLDPLA